MLIKIKINSVVFVDVIFQARLGLELRKKSHRTNTDSGANIQRKTISAQT